MNTLVPITAIVRHVSTLPALWSRRVVARERLGALPERLLADIGLDHAAVAHEVRKPFWRPFNPELGAGAPRFQPTAGPSRAPVPMPAVLRPVTRLSGATFPMLS